MSFVPSEIEQYCIEHSTRPGPIPRALQDFTKTSVHGSNMLIGEMEGAVLGFLIRFGKVKKILELGTYTGYSALVMAEYLPEDGRVVTVDINPETSKIAKEYWAKSPHGKKIELILKPGLEALKEITTDFDLIFIDADKNNYPHYLDWSLEHLSPQGVIVVDNTLWSGKVLLESSDKQTESIRIHNEKAKNLQGYTKTLLPIRDGMFLIHKN